MTETETQEKPNWWNRGHPKNAPKTVNASLIHWLTQRPDLLNFPPAPCSWLCKRKGTIRRFHFTCFTCYMRRYFYRTRRSENLREYKTLVMILESPSGTSYILPDTYMTYGLVIPTSPQGLVNPVKAGTLKVLLTIAERIAEF